MKICLPESVVPNIVSAMNSKTIQEQHTNGRRLTDKQLGPLIKFANTHRGVKAHVQHTMSQRLDRQVTYPTVSKWLHPDPALRSMLDFETGLVLLEIWKEIKNGNFR